LWGAPTTVKLRSLDGKKTLVAVMTQEQVLSDGVLFDEWISKEEGGAFLREERLARPKKVEDAVGVEIAEGVMRFSLPESFFGFVHITPSHGYEGDPFEERKAGEHRLLGVPVDEANYPGMKKYRDEVFYDATDFLRKNGVSFREGDYALFGETKSMLFVKAPKVKLELIEGIVLAACGGAFRLIRVDFTQVESAEKVDGKRLETGEFSLVRKVGSLVLPGQIGEVRLGEDLAFELEAQFDGQDQVVEMRARLTEDGGDLEKASFKTRAILKVGVPVVVQQVRKGDKWMAWVVTAEILEAGSEQ